MAREAPTYRWRSVRWQDSRSRRTRLWRVSPCQLAKVTAWLAQLLVLQPHAVVQPHSVRLHFRHGHKNPLGHLSACPNKAQPRPHPHALRAVLCCSAPRCSRFVTPKSVWITSSSRSSGARAGSPLRSRHALAVADDQRGVRPPGLGGAELLSLALACSSVGHASPTPAFTKLVGAHVLR